VDRVKEKVEDVLQVVSVQGVEAVVIAEANGVEDREEAEIEEDVNASNNPLIILTIQSPAKTGDFFTKH
jgi:hypothetical protein